MFTDFDTAVKQTNDDFIFMATPCINDIKHFYCPTNAHKVKKNVELLKHFKINTFTAIVDLSRFNNSCLKSRASTLVDLTFQSRALRSFSLNQLRNLSL